MSIFRGSAMSCRKRLQAILWMSVASATLLPAAASFAQALPSAFTTGYRYNVANQLTGVIRPDPDDAGPLHFPAVRNTYDSAGRLVSVETGELLSWQPDSVAPAAWSEFTTFQTTLFTYDGLGRKTSQQLQSGSTPYLHTQTSYDAAGRVECVAQRMYPAEFGSLPSSACVLGTEGPNGPDRITRTTYDTRNLPLTIQRAYGTPLQQTYAEYTYSSNGLRRTVKDANGNLSRMTYNGHDELERWEFPSPSTAGQVNASDYEEYGYDLNGNRNSLRKRDGQTIGFTHDELNRMRVKDIPGSTTADVYFGYDLRNLQTSARFGSATGPGLTNVYDGFGRLKSSSNNQDNVTRTVLSDYDADGNRFRVTYPDGNFFEYAYDGLDRLIHISENGPSASLASIFYDAQGRRLGLDRGTVPATTTDYGYDAISRLQSVVHDLDGTVTTNDVSMTFSYSPASQILTRTLSNNAYVLQSTVATRTYAVNGLNQYTQISGGGSVTPTWDSRGNLTFDGATTFTYDIENRLKSAVGGGKNATLKYDPAGRLYEVAAPSGTTRFVHDGDRLIAEYSSGGGLLRRYVHGVGVDEPLLWYEGSGVSNANRRYLHADHQGSIVSVASSTGSMIEVNKYDSYGVTTSAITSRFQYTGQAAIPEIGLYYYKARMYNAALGRFMQTDTVGYDDDLNLYAYVGNDPLNRVDPAGTNTIAIGGGLVALGGLWVTYTACEANGGCDSMRDAANQFFLAVEDTLGNVVSSIGGMFNEEGEGDKTKTATANPDGTVTDAQGNPINGESGGPGAGKRFKPESPETKAAKEGVPCKYCGQPTTNEQGKPNSRNRDHIDAKSKGGNNSPGNEADACRTCNAGPGGKSDKDLWTWVKEKFGGGLSSH